MTDSAPEISAPSGDIVAHASRSYRAKWVFMGIAMLAYGGWSLYDGFVGWPAENGRAIAQAHAANKTVPEKLPHDALGVTLNKLIGITLQPLGLFVLFWAFYNSRGFYRLSGGTLEVPGHPPVPMGAIRAIDESAWDRKGIAYIEYELGSKTARLRLDDYVYERRPVDLIHDRILSAVAPADPAATIATDVTPAV